MAAAMVYLRSGSGALRILSSPPALVHEIQKLNELVTVKYSVQKVVGLEEQKLPFGTEKLLLIVQAKVLGGIDLQQMREGDVIAQPQGGFVVRLPRPAILHVIIDEKETKVWDRQVTWWTPWVPYNNDLERKARLTAIEEVKQSAMQMGVLEDAQRQAEAVIRNFLEAFGVKQITFRSTS